MNGLDDVFAGLWSGLEISKAADFQVFPGAKKGNLESQLTEVEDFSSVSSISRAETEPEFGPEEKCAQARASACAGGRAMGYVENRLETLETLEKTAPAGTCISSSLSRNLERLEKRGARSLPLPGAPIATPGLAFDERAAFLEYECGLSRAAAEVQARAETRQAEAELLAPRPAASLPPLPSTDGVALWRAGLARLVTIDPERPSAVVGYRAGEWPRVYERAIAFLDQFGAQAEALGWTASRLFGVHPSAGIVRVDHCGALVLPIGGPVRAITATEIALGHLTHRYKSYQPQGVPIWEFSR